jgi:hypothetical protein
LATVVFFLPLFFVRLLFFSGVSPSKSCDLLCDLFSDLRSIVHWYLELLVDSLFLVCLIASFTLFLSGQT